MTDFDPNRLLYRIDYRRIEYAVAKGIIRALLWIIGFQILLAGLLVLFAVMNGQFKV